MTRNRSLRLLAVLASLSVITPITAAKADKTEDCLTEMNHLASKTTALSMLVTKVLKEADGDIASFLANPTDARLGAFTESLIRAVETVTKRPVYSFARNLVTTEAFEITKAAKAEAADMTAVAGLFDEDEQAVLEQERRGRIQPLLTKAAGLGVRAALTWCNRPGGSTAP